MASITHPEYIFTFWLSPPLSICLTSPQSFSHRLFFLTHTRASIIPPSHTYIQTDRQQLTQQAEWNHPHMLWADTYMCSHSDTISYTPWIYTRILLKPWQLHPPSTSLQSIRVCNRWNLHYYIVGVELVALVTELNVRSGSHLFDTKSVVGRRWSLLQSLHCLQLKL